MTSFDIVSFIQCNENIGYPTDALNPSFHPSFLYPEYPFPKSDISTVPNPVYEGVRSLFFSLGLDKENFGTPYWNPLGDLVDPGQKVVIKPNFVRHYHRLRKTLDCVVTHASVIRPIMDYTWIALKGQGAIIVADAPQGDADFQALIRANGMASLFAYYENYGSEQLQLELRDLRKEWTIYKYGGVVWDRVALPGDPEGYLTVDLGEESEYAGVSNKNYYGADYDRDRTKRFHNEKQNQYNISKTILNADVFICVPKLKVHRKVGVTLNIKNLIGINGEKNFLPHFVVGSPDKGGDEFSNDTLNNKIDRALKDFLLWKHHRWGKYLYVVWHVFDKCIFRRMQRSQVFIKGDWWGNDTTWRSAVDLNKILLYCNKKGEMQENIQRRYLSVVDGIVAGEGEGPLTPDPIFLNVLIGGFSPLSVDLFATTVMGIDWRKIKMLAGAVSLRRYRLTSSAENKYEVVSNVHYDFSKPVFKFRLPSGWKGHAELEE